MTSYCTVRSTTSVTTTTPSRSPKKFRERISLLFKKPESADVEKNEVDEAVGSIITECSSAIAHDEFEDDDSQNEDPSVEKILKQHVANEDKDQLDDLDLSMTSDEILLEQMTHMNTLKNQHISSAEEERKSRVYKELKKSRKVNMRIVIPIEYKLQHKWCVWSDVQLRDKKRRKLPHASSVGLQTTIRTKEDLDKSVQSCVNLLERYRGCAIHLFHKGVEPQSNDKFLSQSECLALKVGMGDVSEIVKDLFQLVCDERLFEYDHIDSYWLKLTIVGISLLHRVTQNQEFEEELYTVVKIWLKPNGVIDGFTQRSMKDMCQILFDCSALCRSSIPALMYTESRVLLPVEYKDVW